MREPPFWFSNAVALSTVPGTSDPGRLPAPGPAQTPDGGFASDSEQKTQWAPPWANKAASLKRRKASHIGSGKVREAVNVAKLAPGQIKEHLALIDSISGNLKKG